MLKSGYGSNTVADTCDHTDLIGGIGGFECHGNSLVECFAFKIVQLCSVKASHRRLGEFGQDILEALADILMSELFVDGIGFLESSGTLHERTDTVQLALNGIIVSRTVKENDKTADKI